jgi:hypothetical protein
MNLKITFFKYVLLLVLAFGASYAHASIIRGTIDPAHYTAQVCEDEACTVTTTSPVNFGYFTTAFASNIVVVDTELTGFMWGTKFGWVVLNCSDTTSGCNSTNGYFKVANDYNGHLSGYAWGDSAGWINFGPFVNNNSVQVSINTSGQLNGYAWSQNFGWIKFDCTLASSCVTTDWRPQNSRPQCSDGIDNDSDRYIDAADGACHTDGNAGNSGTYDPTNNREQAQQFRPNYPVVVIPPLISVIAPEPIPTPVPIVVTPKPVVKKPIIKTPPLEIQEPTSFPESNIVPQGEVFPVQPPSPLTQTIETHYLPTFLERIGAYLKMVPPPTIDNVPTAPKIAGPQTSPVRGIDINASQVAKTTFIQKVIHTTTNAAKSTGTAVGSVLNGIGNFFNSIFSRMQK